MNKTDETEFLKLFKCCTESGTETLCAFARYKLLSGYGNDFKKFLEDKRHFFYHQWITKQVACCECPPAGCSIRKIHKMENWIFRKFYSDTGNEDPKHVIKSGGCVSQICIHKYVVNNIKIDDLDISLLYYLLCYNATLSVSEKKALDTLNSIRAQLSHASSTKCFSSAKLNDMWIDFERAILDITLPSYHKILERQIQFHKFYVLNSEDTVKLRSEMEKITSEIKDVKGIHSENNNFILSHIDKSGDGIKRQVVEESAKTQRELCFQLQDLKSEVTNIRREAIECKEYSKNCLAVISDQQNDIKLIQQEQTKFTHQINNLVFKVKCTKPANILDTEEKIVEGETDQAVLFAIETPKGFDFDSVKIQKDSFNGEHIKVKFVRRGSLIMMTTVHTSVLYDDQVFEATVKSFLTRLVEACKIDTDTVCELEVTLHVLTSDEVNFSFEIKPTAQQIQREDKATQVSLRNTEMASEMTRLIHGMTRLQKEIYSKNSEITRLKQEIYSKDWEITRLKQEIYSKDSEIARVQKEIYSKDSEITRLKQEIYSKDSEITRLQKEIYSKDSEITRLQKEVQIKNYELCTKDYEMPKPRLETAGSFKGKFYSEKVRPRLVAETAGPLKGKIYPQQGKETLTQVIQEKEKLEKENEILKLENHHLIQENTKLEQEKFGLQLENKRLIQRIVEKK